MYQILSEHHTVSLCCSNHINDSLARSVTSAFTYSPNSYITSSGADISVWKMGAQGIVKANLDITSLASGNEDKTIGRIQGTLRTTAIHHIPSCTGKGTIIFIITAEGLVQLSNRSGAAASGLYRALIPVVFA